MDIGELIPIMGILLVMIPVAGMTFIATMRLALKPLVESLSKSGLLRSGEADHRIVDLERQVEELSAEVKLLRDGQTFDEQLLNK